MKHLYLFFICLSVFAISPACEDATDIPTEIENPDEPEEPISGLAEFEGKNPSIIGTIDRKLILKLGDCFWEYDTEKDINREIYCAIESYRDFSFDGETYLYFSFHNGGILQLDIHTKRIARITTSNSCLPSNKVLAIAAEPNGLLWCAPAEFKTDFPLYDQGYGLYLFDWNNLSCSIWDTTNSNLPYSTVVDMDARNGQVYFSAVDKLYDTYNHWTAEYLMHFDGSEFTVLDSGDQITPLIRGIDLIAKGEIAYSKSQSIDLVNDRYELFLWDSVSQSSSRLMENRNLLSARLYRDEAENQFIFGNIKSLNAFNKVIGEPFVSFNGINIQIDTLSRINSLQRFETEDSMWVGSSSLFYLALP